MSLEVATVAVAMVAMVVPIAGGIFVGWLNRRDHERKIAEIKARSLQAIDQMIAEYRMGETDGH